jgi:hypothetical protein
MSQVADIYGKQEDVNAGIYNTYSGQKNQLSSQEALFNSGIDEKNMENKYNYGLWKTGNYNKIIGDTAGTSGQVFGNMTKYNNQLDYYNALSKGYSKELLDRNQLNPNLPIQRKGGTIKKRTLMKSKKC